MKVSASSDFVGPVDEGCRIIIGFELFFCRIRYVLSPAQRSAYPGVVAVEADEVIAILDRLVQSIAE
jgi:hypothetical protein